MVNCRTQGIPGNNVQVLRMAWIVHLPSSAQARNRLRDSPQLMAPVISIQHLVRLELFK
jgi:hypothetical protein